MEKYEQFDLILIGISSCLLGLYLNSKLQEDLIYYNNPKYLLFLGIFIPIIYYTLRLELYIIKKLYDKIINHLRNKEVN